jgi:8-amino-7-oxononanoate synthase
MDGDFAPLREIAERCEKYEAGLIVDEAHATGIFGEHGEGCVQALNLQNKCLARVHTFGKAMGAHGAVILGSQDLKSFLINYCRPFIFSTALPRHTLAAIKCAYQFLPEVDGRRKKLFQLAALFEMHYTNRKGFELLPGNSAIKSILIPGNEVVKQFAEKIQQAGFDVRPIVYPTVAKGAERIRICIHSFNTEQEVIKLAELINTI